LEGVDDVAPKTAERYVRRADNIWEIEANLPISVECVAASASLNLARFDIARRSRS